MRKPNLNSLLFFDTAARLGSFVQAAQALHVTHGAVSRQIRQLESELGLSLFERRNRAVFLTPNGHRLLTTTRRIFDDLDETVKKMRQEHGPGPLVVSCEPTITMKWLIPNLPRFNSTHPDIPLHIFAAGGPIDFGRQGIDVALRRNDFYWDRSTHAVEVASEWIGPVCAPPLALSRKARQNLRDLPRLHTERRLSAWEDWSRAAGMPIEAKAGQTYEYFHLSIQAAIAGMGVAISSLYMVQEELSTGRLVAPLGFVRDGSSYFLLSPTAPGEHDPLTAFTDWIRMEMRVSAHALHALQAAARRTTPK